MRWLAGLTTLLACVAACSPGPSSVFAKHSPSPSSSPAVAQASASPSPTESPATPSPSPAPLKVSCQGGGSGGSMVMIQGSFTQQQLLYDVSDPVHPRLLCSFAHT